MKWSTSFEAVPLGQDRCYVISRVAEDIKLKVGIRLDKEHTRNEVTGTVKHTIGSVSVLLEQPNTVVSQGVEGAISFKSSTLYRDTGIGVVLASSGSHTEILRDSINVHAQYIDMLNAELIGELRVPTIEGLPITYPSDTEVMSIGQHLDDPLGFHTLTNLLDIITLYGDSLNVTEKSIYSTTEGKYFSTIGIYGRPTSYCTYGVLEIPNGFTDNNFVFIPIRLGFLNSVMLSACPIQVNEDLDDYDNDTLYVCIADVSYTNRNNPESFKEVSPFEHYEHRAFIWHEG